MRKILLILAGLAVVALIGIVVVISQIDVSEYKEQAWPRWKKQPGARPALMASWTCQSRLTLPSSPKVSASLTQTGARARYAHHQTHRGTGCLTPASKWRSGDTTLHPHRTGCTTGEEQGR